MRRRLEKWSQGWVIPVNRQPRRMGATTGENVNKSLSAECVAPVGQTPRSPLASSSDEVFRSYTEPTSKAAEAMYCLYPTELRANQEAPQCLEPLFLPCSIQMSKGELHLERDFKKVMTICLKKVTDVALLQGQNEQSSSAIPLGLSEASPVSKPKLASEDTDLSELMLWDLPPIPFGQLPVCVPSLPSRWQVPQKVPAGRWLQGRPLGDFDRSNVQLNDSLSLGLLPLHPCLGRLPLQSRQQTESYTDRIHAWVQAARQSIPTEMKSLLVIWVSSSEMAGSSGQGCRLAEGVPTILAFAGATGASQQRKEILRCRAEVLG
eukprot:Skav229056  [mRNA]  locus=scaffold2611:14880:15842:+ [translate_table: standard]